jgi:transposase-like protein/IS1 family transposase
MLYNECMEAMIEAKPKMICRDCEIRCASFGKHRNGLRRFRCVRCKKTYTEAHENLLGAMTVPMEKAVIALKMLVEGSSIRTIERITELHRDTIMRLLVLAGENCERLLAEKITNLRVKDVEADEMWGYVAKKENHKQPEERDSEEIGDAYTFVGMERNTKVILAWHLGRRTKSDTMLFMQKLRRAVNPQHWFQLTTDGFPAYVPAVEYYFGHQIDFAQLIKVYRASSDTEQRYSPGEVAECIPVPVFGNPIPSRICTSHIERQNLTMRMQMRRLTRLTNAFSKKRSNLSAALALHFAYYNFCRIHSSLRVTPAMAAEITDRQWSIAELLA